MIKTWSEALDLIERADDCLVNGARDYRIEVVREPYTYLWLHHVFRKEGDQWKTCCIYPYYSDTKGGLLPLVVEIQMNDNILKFTSTIKNFETFTVTLVTK